MGAAGGASEAGDEAAGIGIPVRRAEPDKRRDEVDAAIVGNRGGQRLGFGRSGDGFQFIADPLNGSSSYEDAAFDGKLGLGAGGGSASG